MKAGGTDLSSRGYHSLKCVLFDLDGTLYDSVEYSERLELEIAKYVSQALGLSEDSAREILLTRRKRLGTLTQTLASLGIDRQRFFETIAERVDPRMYLAKDQTIQDVLQALRNRGLKVGLVSNSGRTLVERVLNAIGLSPEVFDVVVTSSEVEPKPSPHSFLLAMKRTNSDTSHTLYVGDRDEAELRPAKELGIWTILLTRTGIQENRWADHVIRSIIEVPSIVERVAQRSNTPAQGPSD
jgi:putative hydrolase of the HAD superfamily